MLSINSGLRRIFHSQVEPFRNIPIFSGKIRQFTFSSTLNYALNNGIRSAFEPTELFFNFIIFAYFFSIFQRVEMSFHEHIFRLASVEFFFDLIEYR